MSRDKMSAFLMDGTPGCFSSPGPCRAGTKSRKTVLTVMHRLTTDAGIPFIPRILHDTSRKEASDARVYLRVRHGRKTADADNQKETCTEVIKLSLIHI